MKTGAIKTKAGYCGSARAMTHKNGAVPMRRWSIRENQYPTCRTVSDEMTIKPLEWHWRHGSSICSVALSGQAPKSRSGAPKAQGLRANAHTELQFK
jgi:hypothetical protein